MAQKITQKAREHQMVYLVGIEHVNRRLKIFQILAQRYRNRRRRYGLRCNLLSAIHNQELPLSAQKFLIVS